MIKLHLGCGSIRIPGYTNIDIRYLPTVDKVDNIKFLRSYALNSVDVIYACAVLEHFSRWDYKTVLKRWYEIIKPNGCLRISVPSWEALVACYLETKELRPLIGMLYGGQDYEYNFHHHCWDFKTMEADLKEVGFSNIKLYDWRKTEHSEIDDFSQAYIPHMDKANGRLMHLNVEAFK